jgi:small-conductance mechanosensitive channel
MHHYYHGEADGVVNNRFTSHASTAVYFLAVFFFLFTIPGYFGCVPKAAHAQILPKPGPATAPVTKPPEQKGEQVKESVSIPVADIAHAAEETAAKLKLFHSTGLIPDPLVEQIKIDFDPVSLSIDELKTYAEQRSLEQMSSTALFNLRQQGSFYNRKVENWQNILKDRAVLLEDIMDQLREMEKVWTLTRDGARKNVPRALLDHISAVLKDIGATKIEAKERLDGLLNLQERISGKVAVIAGIMARIDDSMARERKSLTQRDSLPLWSAFGETRPLGIPFHTQIRDLGVVFWTSILVFLENYGIRVIVHLLLFMGLTAFLLVLRRYRGESGPAMGIAANSLVVVARPYSAACLLALAWTPFLYPLAPMEISKIAFVIAYIPLLRLSSRVMRPALYGLFVAYLINQFVDLSLQQQLQMRLLLLFDTAFALALLVFFARIRARRGGKSLMRSGWIFSALVVLCGVGLGISLVSNGVGNATLAEFFTEGIITAACLLVIVSALVRVLVELVDELLLIPAMQSSHIMRLHREQLGQRFSWIVRIAGKILWVVGVLAIFRVVSFLGSGLADILKKEWTFGTTTISVWDILAFLLVLFVAVLLSRLIRFLLREEIFPRLTVRRGPADAIVMLANYVIYGFGIYLALSVAGVGLNKFTLLAGALGIGIGFGLQSIVNNFVSGLVLAFERPVNVGDVIQTGKVVGTVARLGVRASIVRTFEGAEVIIPNGDLISKEVTNWTLSDPDRRIEVHLGVAYGTDPHRVIELMTQVAIGHPRIIEDPAPIAYFEGFGEWALNFRLHCWTRDFNDWLTIRSDIALSIHDALKKAGISMSFLPHDVHIRSTENTADVEVPAK